jgi:hypothetical protein
MTPRLSNCTCWNQFIALVDVPGITSPRTSSGCSTRHPGEAGMTYRFCTKWTPYCVEVHLRLSFLLFAQSISDPQSQIRNWSRLLAALCLCAVLVQSPHPVKDFNRFVHNLAFSIRTVDQHFQGLREGYGQVKSSPPKRARFSWGPMAISRSPACKTSSGDGL